MWWVRSDMCGLFSAGLTVVLILFAQLVIVKVVILPWLGFSLHVLLFTSLTMLALICHSRAQFTDPGAVTWDQIPPPPVYTTNDPMQPPPVPPRVCRRCKTLKPFKAHHCSSCRRCIVRMDHHCPWVNNCVAMFNQKYFLLFLIYTATSCLYAGFLLVSRFLSCTGNLSSCSLGGWGAVLCVAVFIEAIIFGLFCCIMLWDQLSAIFENTPGIDAMQNRRGIQRGKYESLQEVFGEPMCWRWWLPLNLPQRIMEDFQQELKCMEDPMVEEMRRVADWQQVNAQQQQHGIGEHVHGGMMHDGRNMPGMHASLLHGVEGPIVFPDGYNYAEHMSMTSVPVERDADDPLAGLQSPPRSPTLRARQHTAVHQRKAKQNGSSKKE